MYSVPNPNRYFIYNILGRACHLLGDMSVPAHVHVDEHGGGDDYEDSMDYGTHPSNVTVWNAESVYQNKGGFIDPYCWNKYNCKQVRDPLDYLFYTTAQIADHFASRRHDGNNNYCDCGEISEILNNVGGMSREGSSYGYPHEPIDLELIKDVTFPYEIRATAGFLYWFAVETGLLNPNGQECILATQYVQNQTLAGNHYMFSAGEIDAGYDVTNTINTGNVVISSTAKDVDMHAAHEIHIQDGFAVNAGANFHAYIAPCNSVCPEYQTVTNR